MEMKWYKECASKEVYTPQNKLQLISDRFFSLLLLNCSNQKVKKHKSLSVYYLLKPSVQ